MSSEGVTDGFNLLSFYNVKVPESPSRPVSRGGGDHARVLTPQRKPPAPSAGAHVEASPLLQAARPQPRGDPVLKRTRVNKRSQEEVTPKVTQHSPRIRSPLSKSQASPSASVVKHLDLNEESPDKRRHSELLQPVKKELLERSPPQQRQPPTQQESAPQTHYSTSPGPFAVSPQSHQHRPARHAQSPPAIVDEITPSEAVDPDIVCDICINGALVKEKAERLRAQRMKEIEEGRRAQAMNEQELQRQRELAEQRKQQRHHSMQQHAEQELARKQMSLQAEKQRDHDMAAAIEYDESIRREAFERELKARNDYKATLDRQIAEKQQRAQAEKARDATFSPEPFRPDNSLAEQRKKEYRAQLEKQIAEKARQRLEEQQSRKQPIAQSDEQSARYADYLQRQMEIRQAMIGDWKKSEEARKSKQDQEAARRAAAAEAAQRQQQDYAAEIERQQEAVKQRRAEFAAALKSQIEATNRRKKHDDDEHRGRSPGHESMSPASIRRYLLKCKGCERPLPPNRFSKLPKAPWK